MKKLICILTVCMLCGNICVNGATLGDMTQRVMEYFEVEVTEDTSGIAKLQNRRSIENPALISAAVNNGIIIPRDGLVNEKGTDYTPLTDGLIKRYINDNDYRFASGTRVSLLRNQNIVFDKNTVFITEKSSADDLNYTDVYTCVVDRNDTAVFVWKASDIKQPSIYKVKLYWIEGDELVATEMYRKRYDLWLKESNENFYTLDASRISVSEEFIMNNLDKYVYIFADGYGGKTVVRGISD